MTRAAAALLFRVTPDSGVRSLLVTGDRLAEYVAIYGSAGVALLVEDVDDVAENEREVVNAGDRVAEDSVEFLRGQAGPALQRIGVVHRDSVLIDIALDLREKLSGLIELLIEHDGSSPYVADPESQSPDVPASTVAEMPGATPSGAGAPDAEAGSSPRPASASSPGGGV